MKIDLSLLESLFQDFDFVKSSHVIVIELNKSSLVLVLDLGHLNVLIFEISHSDVHLLDFLTERLGGLSLVGKSNSEAFFFLSESVDYSLVN